MRFDRHRESRPGVPLQRRPPPDYTQRSTKRKLFILVAALMVVLAFADRVRDPKNWQWLWKGEETKGEAAPKFTNRLQPKPSRTAFDPPGTFISAAEPEAAPGESTNSEGEKGGLTIDPVQRAWDQGWKDVFDRLDADRRTLLFEMLHAGTSHAAIAPERQQSAADLMPLLSKLWEDYQSVAFQSVAQLKGEDQALWVDVLRQVNGRFNDELRPAMQAVIDGRAPSETEEKALAAFQQTLVALTRRRIQDDTVFRPAEREVWFHELARVQGASAEELAGQSVGEIAYLQLFNQPTDYRGQVVTVTGTAKLAYRVQAPDNYLGIKEYYVYWIHPSGGPTSPIVVYALAAPPGFPEIKDKDIDRQTTKLHEELRVTGVFFKRWAYLAKDGTDTYTAPLVLAHTPQWKQGVQIAPAHERMPLTLQNILAVVGTTFVLALLVGLVLYRTASARSRAAVAANAAEPANLGDLSVGPTTEETLRAMERDARSGKL